MIPPASSATSVEQSFEPSVPNEDVVLRFVRAAFERFDGEAIAGLVTADFRAHPWLPLSIPPGPEGMRPVVAALAAAFSDAHVTVDDVVAEGDRVVMRYTFEADHAGPLMGVEATGRRVRFPGILIARLEGGRLAEYWREEDQLGLMQQLRATSSADV